MRNSKDLRMELPISSGGRLNLIIIDTLQEVRAFFGLVTINIGLLQDFAQEEHCKVSFSGGIEI